MGLRLDWLGTEALSWRDLLVIVRQAPRGSAIRRAVDPSADYALDLELLRAIELHTRTAIWALTRDAKSGRNTPKPVRFPWEADEPDAFGMDVMTTEEMARRLGWPTPIK